LDVEFAFLCDAALESGGKVSALGIGIDQITAAAVPAVHPMLGVVVGFRYIVTESGTKKVEVRLIDADGGNVVPPVEGEMVLADPTDGLSGRGNLILQLGGLQFPKYGQYSVEIGVGGQSIASIPLRVSPPVG
jgi:hypothetical protein